METRFLIAADGAEVGIGTVKTSVLSASSPPKERLSVSLSGPRKQESAYELFEED